MSREYITESIWCDPEGTGYIMLDVTDQIEPPSSTVIDGVELLAKSEFHVSLVPVHKLTEDRALQRDILEDVQTYLEHTARVPEFVGLGDERYLCRDGEEVTVVASADIVGLEGLQRVVRDLLPDYRPAFPHVTLLKNAASKYGIGINSVDDLARFCQKLD